MKNIIGFGAPQEEPALAPMKQNEIATPVRSVVDVVFQDDTVLRYYNDRFDLRAGDGVYVSGKRAGSMGIVKSVTTKFKINLSCYERVLARIDFQLRGSFEPIGVFMVGVTPDVDPSPELFRFWVQPPEDEETEYACGEGYELELDHFEQDDEVDPKVLSRALDYCRRGRVRYLALRDGVGTAFVEGTAWYEVNFRYDAGRITELYCSCPYLGLCKHELAVLFMLRALLKELKCNCLPDLTAIDQSFFWRIVSTNRQRVTL